MAKIGFLGLGEMGTPMASRLIHAGHSVTVWNRSPEKTVPLALLIVTGFVMSMMRSSM